MNRLEKKPTAQTPAFGLIAWLESTRVTLPLKAVECRFDITASVASVEMDQVFHQNNSKPLDCTYTFPLPAGAAVYRCEMHVNGRVIRAKVEERGRARQMFAEQKALGRRATLVEAERENLFTLSLGNTQPGDVIVIRFAYFQKLDRLADALSLRIPVCPGVRYIPGQPLLRSLQGGGTSDDTDLVPDASRISPPRIDALHPDAARFSVQGTLAASDLAAGSLSSPSHPVLVHEKAAVVWVSLAAGSSVPDRDLVLRWTEPKAATLEPRGWSYRHGAETFALVQLRAPTDVPVTRQAPHDVYFLIDHSGSMVGQKWVKTCEALRAFIDLLGLGDRVWITVFDSTFTDFAEAPLSVATIRADTALENLMEIAPTGGTELGPAADHVLKTVSRHSNGRRASIVLITDGQVGNESAILQAFRRHRVTVFTFGIDGAVNDAFLDGIARATGGECWLQTPNDDIAGTVAKLGDRLRRPVLTNLSIAARGELPGAKLPDLYGGHTEEISLRFDGVAPKFIQFDGLLPDGEIRCFTVPLAPVTNEALALLWARERIATLLATGVSDQAVAFAKRYNLLCEGAAFIAWDEAEQVPLASESIYQPSHRGALESELRDAHLIGCSHLHMECLVDPGLSSGSEGQEQELDEHRLFMNVFGTTECEKLAVLLCHWVKQGERKRKLRARKLTDLLKRINAERSEKNEMIQMFEEFVRTHLATAPDFQELALQAIEKWRKAEVTA